MKRLVCIIWVLVFVLTLAACAGDSSGFTAGDSPQRAESAADGFNFSDNGEAKESVQSPAGAEAESGEGYLTIDENGQNSTDDESMLTFSLKVDTAAYTNVQRYIESGNTPPADAVRTEELLNYFSFDGETDFTEGPFSLSAEIGPSPFDRNKKLAMIRVKTDAVDTKELPSSNLCFLIDTSGSMDSYDKLPLLKEAFALLVETLGENDRVSIVTYAGSAGVVLDGMSGENKQEILKAIHMLEPGGSTAGADGIYTAYKLAEKNFRQDGNNRVILATDGDFNVGPSDTDSLSRLVSEKRDSGVYLSILGFGTGNIRDDIMETLSKDGNGNYAYINDVGTAEKVLVEEMGTNLFTVADDVKAQVEFNPENVKSYRLIGYENRQLQNEDFEDDSKDAGEVGAGTDVVLLFELELQDGLGGEEYKYGGGSEDPDGSAATGGDYSGELFEVRIRYKDPGEPESKLLAMPVFTDQVSDSMSTDLGFASSVAGFCHLLRESEQTGDFTYEQALRLAEENLGGDSGGYRHGYVRMLRQYGEQTAQ